MPKIRFKKTILQATTLLTQHGYQPASSEAGEMIPLRKMLNSEIDCAIMFQLMQHSVPPRRRINVWLLREPRPTGRELAENYFPPLHIDLVNLVRGYYGIEVFSPGTFHWEFTDELGLFNQVQHIQSLLIEYGIKWLEDPFSNMDWVYQSGRP